MMLECRRARIFLCLSVLCASLPLEVNCLDCQLLTLPFGRLLYTNSPSPQQMVPQRTVAMHECARGYRLVDAASGNALSTNFTLQCLDTGLWNVTGSSVQCAAVSCGSPPVVQNAEVVSNSEESLVGSTVTYRCASQYRFDQQSSDGSLVTPQNGTVTSVCGSEGEWHSIPTCSASPVVSEYNVLVIVLSLVTVLCVCALLSTLFFAFWAFKIRREYTKGDMADDEVAYAQSHGGIILNNPLVMTKDDAESVGNPLYLTPDEMDEFESKKKQTTSQSG